jgi:hypothetical protein
MGQHLEHGERALGVGLDAVERWGSLGRFIWGGAASQCGGGGESAAAGGAPLIHRLHEEEATRWPFDEGEMKRG